MERKEMELTIPLTVLSENDAFGKAEIHSVSYNGERITLSDKDYCAIKRKIDFDNKPVPCNPDNVHTCRECGIKFNEYEMEFIGNICRGRCPKCEAATI